MNGYCLYLWVFGVESSCLSEIILHTFLKRCARCYGFSTGICLNTLIWGKQGYSPVIESKQWHSPVIEGKKGHSPVIEGN